MVNGLLNFGPGLNPAGKLEMKPLRTYSSLYSSSSQFFIKIRKSSSIFLPRIFNTSVRSRGVGSAGYDSSLILL
ncbi:hypothetical protein OGAPHI_002641 [Ogataea philodendri]|uniref:Uncharacterized protein n=1 Tax=Ogataea philodendri TaxID=1378263 RepID=A0A9P8T8D1_9ASCO|nr:uncharacterized protein OGAPHI_002641 [Ogataea philodendri]KAH3668886.1 hypothetical protein OGAPHI_002641 [Ogataea philodendri]